MDKYSKTINNIFNLSPLVKDGLKNIEKIDSIFGHPHRSYKIVHVAGTNGKGSVSCKVARGLELEGFCVGLFISPHISDFRERITINGKQISKADVLFLAEVISNVISREKLKITFFEFITAMALLYFRQNAVDYVVLETGLGGRLDATNIADPVLSIITSIAHDHIDVLGDNLRDIAYEKAGIVKKGRPLVLGPRAQKLGIEEIAKDKGSSCYKVDSCSGDFVEENNGIARRALELLGCNDGNITEGLKFSLPARFERVIYGDREFIFDVAHNPDGLRALFLKLMSEYGYDRYIVIMGISRAKDIEEALSIIEEHASDIYLVDTPNKRCLDPQELASYFKLHKPMVLKDKAPLLAFAEKPVIVCGSCYIISTVQDFLGSV